MDNFLFNKTCTLYAITKFQTFDGLHAEDILPDMLIVHKITTNEHR